MKRILASLLLLTATATSAVVPFTWDDTVNPPETSYRLYSVSGTNYTRIVETTNRSAAVTLAVGQHNIVARAVLGGIESEDSNVVSLTVPSRVTINIVIAP